MRRIKNPAQQNWITVTGKNVRTGVTIVMDVPPGDSDLTILGMTSDGNFVASMINPTMMFGLTACCGASAKGSMGAVVCRNCYEDIDPAVDILDESDIEWRVVTD